MRAIVGLLVAVCLGCGPSEAPSECEIGGAGCGGSFCYVAEVGTAPECGAPCTVVGSCVMPDEYTGACAEVFDVDGQTIGGICVTPRADGMAPQCWMNRTEAPAVWLCH